MSDAVRLILEAFECADHPCRGAPGADCHKAAKLGKGKTHCPLHSDPTPSLNCSNGRNGVPVFHCFGGCDQAALWRELHARGFIHEIRDRSGALVARHERKGRWMTADGRSGLRGAKTADMLYGLERLADFDADEPVYLCEGEKAAKALQDLGLLGIGTVCGASVTPSAEALRELAGHPVVLWADSDEAGRSHMRSIARILHELDSEVSWLVWPVAPDGGDAADLVEQYGGNSRSLILELLHAAEVLTAAPPAPATAPVVVMAPSSNGATPRPLTRFDPGWVPPDLALVADDLSSVWKQEMHGQVTAGLAVILTAIGQNLQMVMPGGDIAPALDWFVLVGDSGSGKSPMMRNLILPLRERQHELDREYRAALARWQRYKAEGGEEAKHAGEKPGRQALIHQNSTPERLTRDLASSHDTGSIWFSDELLSLWKGLDEYKQRGSRAFSDLLTMWSADPIYRARVKDDELTIVDRPVVTLLGGIQPHKLHELGSNDDGRLARILPVQVVSGADAPERDPDPEHAARWRDLVLRIVDTRPAELTTIGLDPEAVELWRERFAQAWVDCRARWPSAEEQQVVRPFVSKLGQHVARLALAVYVGTCGQVADLPELDPASIERAWDLGHWYLEQQLSIFAPTALATGQRPHEVEQSAAADLFHRWLIGHYRPPIPKRQVQRNVPRWLYGPAFQAHLEQWQRKGYGDVLKNGQQVMLTWESTSDEEDG